MVWMVVIGSFDEVFQQQDVPRYTLDDSDQIGGKSQSRYTYWVGITSLYKDKRENIRKIITIQVIQNYYCHYTFFIRIT